MEYKCGRACANSISQCALRPLLTIRKERNIHNTASQHTCVVSDVSNYSTRIVVPKLSVIYSCLREFASCRTKTYVYPGTSIGGLV